eukprot:4654244-Amphidinium_carterae.1
MITPDQAVLALHEQNQEDEDELSAPPTLNETRDKLLHILDSSPNFESKTAGAHPDEVIDLQIKPCEVEWYRRQAEEWKTTALASAMGKDKAAALEKASSVAEKLEILATGSGGGAAQIAQAFEAIASFGESAIRDGAEAQRLVVRCCIAGPLW